MADDDDTAEGTQANPDRRRSPLARHVPLWIGFLLVVGIGIGTVLIPEISDDGDEDEEGGVAASSGDGDDVRDDDSEPPAAAAAPTAAP